MASGLTLTVILLGFLTLVRGQCPAIPQCDCSSWTQAVTCLNPGSDLRNILSQIPANTRSLQIKGTNAYSLKEEYFVKIASKNIDELKLTQGQIQAIESKAFSSLSVLRKLSLSQNRIDTIDSQAFVGVGNLQTLDLSKNKISVINHVDMFTPISYLTDLDLSNNQINAIPSGLFSNLRSLRALTLDGNSIHALKGSSFQGLAGLKKLYASHCGVQQVDEDFFSKVSTLDLLDLSFNAFTAVPLKLNMLRQLKNLTLTGNRINKVPDGAFQGLNLETLDLSNNGIQFLQTNTFIYLGSVRYLDLSNNKLVSLPEYVFQPVASQIFSLKLNNNRGLTSLPSSLFQGMQMLQDLNLSFCAITFLPYDLFTQVFSLQRVDFSHNMLKSLPQSFISKANQMTLVRITNNPWMCDCSIRPLRDWLQFPRSSSVLDCGEISPSRGISRGCASQKCTSPQRLLYRDIYTLQDHEIPKCDKVAESSSSPVSIIIGVLVAVLVCLIIVIILVICYCKHKKGEPLLCGESKAKKTEKRRKKEKAEHYREKKEMRGMDPETASMNESDKGFVVRNYFHSMAPDEDEASMATQSMTRRGSQESLSHSGYAYGSRAGSRNSSQYSLNSGVRIESAV